MAGPPPACAPWLTHGPQVRTGPRSWHTRRRGGPTSPNTSTPRARRRVHAGRLDATRRRRATPASGASPDGRRLRNGDGAGCDSHHPTGQDGEHIWPRPAVARAGSDGHVGEDSSAGAVGRRCQGTIVRAGWRTRSSATRPSSAMAFAPGVQLGRGVRPSSAVRS